MPNLRIVYLSIYWHSGMSLGQGLLLSSFKRKTEIEIKEVNKFRTAHASQTWSNRPRFYCQANFVCNSTYTQIVTQIQAFEFECIFDCA